MRPQEMNDYRQCTTYRLPIYYKHPTETCSLLRPPPRVEPTAILPPQADDTDEQGNTPNFLGGNPELSGKQA